MFPRNIISKKILHHETFPTHSPKKISPLDKSACQNNGIQIKSPGKNPRGKNPTEKITLNAVKREPVPTRVLNPNASEASYKPK